MHKDLYYFRKDCRFCHEKDFELLMDFGKQPSQGSYVREGQIGEEKKYPLRLFQCNNCGLVQLRDVVDDKLFQPYISSVSLSKHSQDYAKELLDNYLNEGDFVIEFGSNDGVLLKELQSNGIEVLGIEPDERVAKLAIEKGVNTIIKPFSDELYKEGIRKAKIVLANNVFAHIDDMDRVMEGLQMFLDDGGLFIFEVHDYINILKGNQYDNIYFEHLNYYTVDTLAPYLSKYGFYIHEVRPITTHGGSMRIYAVKIDNSDMKQQIKKQREDLLGLLTMLKSDGKRIIGYGASGRANTMLNYCGIDTTLVDYIIDESPSRYYTFTPGTHIPILPPDKADYNKVDFILLLAWNYEKQIKKKVKYFKGKWIIPMPKVRIA